MHEAFTRALTVLGLAAGVLSGACAGSQASRSAALPPGAEAPSASPAAALGDGQLVDAFETIGGWKALPSDGVEMKLSSDAGVRGRALRIDFRFLKGGGYAVFHQALDLELPENYKFTFRLRGDAQPNNLEFKLLDGSGENVWWCNRRDYRFSPAWETVTIKRRHIDFAWGPSGGGEIRRVAAIELAITAGSGGTGTVWIDELELTPLPAPGGPVPQPVARASSSSDTHRAALASDGDSASYWSSRERDAQPWLELDLGVEREFGGLVIDWLPGAHAADYQVEFWSAGLGRRVARTVAGGNGGRDHLYMPESEARRIRMMMSPSAHTERFAIREVHIKPLEWSASLAGFFQDIALDAPRGHYPRSILGEQSYWTIVGVDGDEAESLISEDGMVETGKAAFSIEPFLFTDGRLVTWSDVHSEQWLEENMLPIPSVRWRADSLELTITAFATGKPGRSLGYARYRLRNRDQRPLDVTLYLALRPFQVNPPTQSLNMTGGIAEIRTLSAEGRVVRVNGDHTVLSVIEPAGFGAATFDQGDIVDYLRENRLPAAMSVNDPFAHASGALAYHLDLSPDGEQEVALLIPLHPVTDASASALKSVTQREVALRMEACARDWRASLERVAIELPDTARATLHALRAQIGYVLINRDGAAIQPGSRAYERSWIRDGSLTSSALLRVGHAQAVREFIEWFAPYQYADGKVPCCVDRRGSDPVPEHDSHGEFIFLVAEHYRYTGDRVLAERMWPRVLAAATYLDSLRQQRRTAQYRTPANTHFFGLLPPSISHEGYSAKPMHSYWDDFFALRGFKDAAYLAAALGHEREAVRLARIRDEFQRELTASLLAAMAVHDIDYLPGSADLGDFDATSTTIALSPAQAEDVLPHAALEETFEQYWEFFRRRRDGQQPWEAFTPYEVRSIGAFVRLGWRERAAELLDYFLAWQRPTGWKQWPEVVRHDVRAPRFLGDLPHSWVGSDFVRSVLDMLAYDREADESLVIGAGIPAAWVTQAPGVTVRDLPTRYGKLAYRMHSEGEGIRISMTGGLRIPRGGIVIRAPLIEGSWTATVNGTPAALSGSGELVVRSLPATVLLDP